MSSGLLLLLDMNPTLLLNNFTHDFSAVTLFIDMSSSISGILNSKPHESANRLITHAVISSSSSSLVLLPLSK